MNFFGIGGWELPIIAIAALLIFGPGKLPEVMGQAGKLVRDFRRMSAELTGEFEKTIAEAKDIGASIQNEVGGMSSQVNSVANSVKQDLGVKGTTAKSKPGVTSKSAASTAASAKANKSSSTTTAKAGGKPTTSSSKAAASSTASKTSAKTSTTTVAASAGAAAKKPEIPVASREDPAAGVSLFEPVAIERPRRSRTATPAVIADRTPRTPFRDATVDQQVLADAMVASGSASHAPDDPLARARQRRRTAGYARQSA